MVVKFSQLKYKYKIVFTLIVILTVILDQITKLVVSITSPNINLKFLTINLIKNTGAGFGILKDQTNLLALISFVVAVVIIFYYRKIPKEMFPQVIFALFLGGVIGNLIDRLFRSYVIDFINFNFWPAFNLADASISIAAICLIIYYWKK